MERQWTRRLSSPPRSVHLARETGVIVVRETLEMSRWSSQGEPLALFRHDCTLRASDCSVDGQRIAVLDERGVVHLLDEEFQSVWKRRFVPAPQSLRLAPLGHGLAVADETGLCVLDGQGRERWRSPTPRALRHLAWVPETDAVVGAAEFGFVGAFDGNGKPLWRDGLVAHIGGLAVRGDGQECLMACFNDGVRQHESDRPGCLPVAGTPPCRALDASYSMDVLFLVDLPGQQLIRYVRSPQVVQQTYTSDRGITALASDSLAQRVVLATQAAELSLVLFSG